MFSKNPYYNENQFPLQQNCRIRKHLHFRDFLEFWEDDGENRSRGRAGMVPPLEESDTGRSSELSSLGKAKRVFKSLTRTRSLNHGNGIADVVFLLFWAVYFIMRFQK